MLRLALAAWIMLRHTLRHEAPYRSVSASPQSLFASYQVQHKSELNRIRDILRSNPAVRDLALLRSYL